MKRTVLTVTLLFVLLLTSCSLYQDIKSELFDTEPNDIDDLISGYIETDESPEDSITVSTSTSYVKTLDEETEHRISIPKIFPATKNAENFNRKIMSVHGEAIEILKNDLEENKIYNISFIFEEYDGVFGILVKDSTSVMNAGGNCQYYGYYYDTVYDRELDFKEYLEILGVDYPEIVRTVNMDILKYYPEEEGYILSENIDDLDISDAIFSPETAHFVLPSFGFGEIRAKYDICFVK